METKAAIATAAGKPLSIETVTLDGPREGEHERLNVSVINATSSERLVNRNYLRNNNRTPEPSHGPSLREIR